MSAVRPHGAEGGAARPGGSLQRPVGTEAPSSGPRAPGAPSRGPRGSGPPSSGPRGPGAPSSGPRAARAPSSGPGAPGVPSLQRPLGDRGSLPPEDTGDRARPRPCGPDPTALTLPGHPSQGGPGARPRGPGEPDSVPGLGTALLWHFLALHHFLTFGRGLLHPLER